MISFLRQSIAAKITLVLSASLIVSTVVFSSVLLLSTKKFFTALEDKIVVESVNKQESKLEQFYLENIQSLKIMSGLLINRPLETKRLLQEFINLNEVVLGVAVISKADSGQNRLKSNKKPWKQFQDNLVVVDGFNLESEFYQKGKIVVSPELSLYPLVEKKFSDKSRGSVTVLRAKISIQDFDVLVLLSAEKLIGNYQIKRKKAVSFISDKSGIFIIHPNPLKQMSYQKEIKYFIDKEFKSKEFVSFMESPLRKSFFGTVQYKGEDRDLFIKRLKIGGEFAFYVGGHFPSRSKVTFGKFVGRKNLLLLSFVLLGLVVIGGFLTRYLLKNLDEITEQAKLFTQGEQDIDIQVKSSDEIGILALTFQGMIRQVNERTRVLRKSERRIRDARDQAEQALSSKSQLLEDLRIQKAEIERVGKDKDDLLAIVSHDLKNPLAVVETSMDLILEEEKGNLSAVTSDLIRRSKSSARIALNLITDLLDLARLEGGIRLDFERFRLDEIVNNVADSFYLKAREKDISIVIGKTHDWEIIADYGRMVQIVSNILGNSIKFTPEEGLIKIDFKKYETDFVYEGSNSGISITISDNGPGIPSDKIESIFDKFAQARTKDREIGTGLGLAICKNICELHNGDISVESVEGSGASFEIRLPRLVDQDFIEVPITSASLSILIVNDDESIRKRLKSLLLNKNGNYSVLEAKNGEEMLKVLETGSPGVIILDYSMPVMNGLEAFKEMQRLTPRPIPTIFLGEGLDSEEFAWIKRNVSDVLVGEVSEEDIVERVDALTGTKATDIVGSKIDPGLKTVLVVDDEEDIRELMVEELAQIGVNPLSAKNGVEALFLLQKYVVDLVVSDIRIGEMDGLTLTKSIKQNYIDTKIILVSANIEGLSDKVSKSLGISHVFVKPFDMSEMNATVVACLGETKISKPRRASDSEIMASLDAGHEFSSNFISNLELKKSIDEKIEEHHLSSQSSSKNTVAEGDGEAVQNTGIEKDKKVLLVDDSEDMQALFKAILRKAEYSVDTADNGEIGVEKFCTGEYEAVFMDMNMPVMNGKDAVVKMRAFEASQGKSSTKIILLTADSLAPDCDEIKAGFNSYIQKPISKKKIIKVLEE
jgi:signal transduction histidine kinase/CheY-like chemotaxis protein